MVPYFTVAKTEEQLQFEYTLENEEKVYGLGENVRGINKRGWIYKSCCADEPNHLEDRTSLYASHNFLVLDGGKEQFGVFFDYPGIITFDVGYTHLNELKITLSEPDADVYVMTRRKHFRHCKTVSSADWKKLYSSEVGIWLSAESLGLYE